MSCPPPLGSYTNCAAKVHKNERGQTRFTVSPDARREILHRLLALNQALSREGYQSRVQSL